MPWREDNSKSLLVASGVPKKLAIKMADNVYIVIDLSEWSNGNLDPLQAVEAVYLYYRQALRLSADLARGESG